MKRWQASRRSFQQRRLGAPGEMRRLFESGSATEPRSAELLGEPKRAEAEEQAVVRRDVESVDAQLSVVQQAMPRLFEIRVQQRLPRDTGAATPAGGPRAAAPKPDRTPLMYTPLHAGQARLTGKSKRA